MSKEHFPSKQELNRSLSPFLLSMYGIGTILGAGIFVLLGEVAGLASWLTPVAFLAASVVALLNGLVYAELNTRSPSAGGPSDYLDHAFSKPWLSQLVAWMIVATGIVSCATIVNGFTGYFNHFFSAESWLVKLGVLACLAIVAIIGVKMSAWFMAITTFLGLLALGFVIYAGFYSSSAQNVENVSQFVEETKSLVGTIDPKVFLHATFLSIYAYIGFEDMVHVAEEVKNPAKAMPIAIITAITVSGLIYLIVSTSALMALPSEELASSKAPLVAVVAASNMVTWPVATLSLAIILNGALAQIIMATRVIYDLKKENSKLATVAQVNPQTQTPIRATLLTVFMVALLTLFFPLRALAGMTSFIMLLLFLFSNVALIVLKHRKADAPFKVPAFLPWLAAMLTFLLLWGSFYFNNPGH